MPHRETIHPKTLVELCRSNGMDHSEIVNVLSAIAPFVSGSTSLASLYRISNGTYRGKEWTFDYANWVHICRELGFDEHESAENSQRLFPHLNRPISVQADLMPIRFTNLKMTFDTPEPKKEVKNTKYKNGKLQFNLDDDRLDPIDDKPYGFRSVRVRKTILINSAGCQHSERPYVLIDYRDKGKIGGVAIALLIDTLEVVLVAEIRPIPGDLYIETPRGFPNWVSDHQPEDAVLRELSEETYVQPVMVEENGRKVVGYKDLALLRTDTGALSDSVQYGLVIGKKPTRQQFIDRFVSNEWQLATVTVSASEFFWAVREPGKILRPVSVYCREDGIFDQHKLTSDGFVIEDSFTICAGNLALNRLKDFRGIAGFERIAELCEQLAL